MWKVQTKHSNFLSSSDPTIQGSEDSRLSTRTTSVYTVHEITKLCNDITWILLALLCRRHPTAPVFPPQRCHNSSTQWWKETPDQCQDSRISRHLPQNTHDSLGQTSPRPCLAWLAPSSRRGIENCFYFFFLTLSTVICCGFFLVTNVLSLSCFGQKRLLNPLNINVMKIINCQLAYIIWQIAAPRTHVGLYAILFPFEANELACFFLF